MKQFLEISVDKRLEDDLITAKAFGLQVDGLAGSIRTSFAPESATRDGDQLFIVVEIQPEPPHFGIIPMSTLHVGSPLKLTLLHKTLGDGQVENRWFEPATRQSRKNLTRMSDASKAALHCTRMLTVNEYKRVQFGLTPLSPDDKWFVYYQDGWLYCHRSGSGIETFQARIEQIENLYHIVEAWFNQDRFSEIESGKFTPEDIFEFILNSLCREARIFE